jgi:hypothetical protein
MIFIRQPLPIPPAPPPQWEGGYIGEIRDLWVLRTHKSLISPSIPCPLGGGEGVRGLQYNLW